MTKPTKMEALAMTVNERLWHFGLMEGFDDAVARQDERGLRVILEEIYLGPENIQAIVNRQIKSAPQD
jgi:hypothetical protein